MNKVIASSVLAVLMVAATSAQAYVPGYDKWLNKLDNQYNSYINNLARYDDVRSNYVETIDSLNVRIADAEDDGNSKLVKKLERAVRNYERKIVKTDKQTDRLEGQVDKVFTRVENSSVTRQELWVYGLDYKVDSANDILSSNIAKRDGYLDTLASLNEDLVAAQESGKKWLIRKIERKIKKFDKKVAAVETTIDRVHYKIDRYVAHIDEACSFLPPGSTGGGYCSASGG